MSTTNSTAIRIAERGLRPNTLANNSITPVWGFNRGAISLNEIRIPNMPSCDGAVYATSDGMYPAVCKGDIVLYKMLHGWRSMVYFGRMFLLSICWDGEEYTTIKTIHESDTPGYYRLKDENQRCGAIDVPISSIKAIALVQGVIRCCEAM